MNTYIVKIIEKYLCIDKSYYQKLIEDTKSIRKCLDVYYFYEYLYSVVGTIKYISIQRGVFTYINDNCWHVSFSWDRLPMMLKSYGDLDHYYPKYT